MDLIHLHFIHQLHVIDSEDKKSRSYMCFNRLFQPHRVLRNVGEPYPTGNAHTVHRKLVSGTSTTSNVPVQVEVTH